MLLQVLTVINVNVTVFWNVVPCSQVDTDRRFRGAYYLQEQDNIYHITRRNIQEVSRHKTNLFTVHLPCIRWNCETNPGGHIL
jgi:hypothetical protein